MSHEIWRKDVGKDNLRLALSLCRRGCEMETGEVQVCAVGLAGSLCWATPAPLVPTALTSGNLWWRRQKELVGYVPLGEKRMEEDLDFILIDRVLICYSFNFTQVIIPYSLL
ncbi:hypothetical protein DV515_00002189 [Chloebia gouldiae]|uniref:Uncharacterized protein n=1 Tax=Chloebia gouldiae TaxID=44316 RepID=A0A3L8SY52_CHLGU|nr:hypothetical protein DV515_00002189 [Chloebia gouldiae]